MQPVPYYPYHTMETLTVQIPLHSAHSHSHSEHIFQNFPNEVPSTPLACSCMSCTTGEPGNRRSFGNTRCLTNTYAIDKLMTYNTPLFNKEQLGKYAEQSPFLMKTPTQEKQADCNCLSCLIHERCLIWDYKPGELAFTQKQLGRYYKSTPLYQEDENNMYMQEKYKKMFM